MESNLNRFQNLVYSEGFGIVCVNETWLSGHIYNSEILHSGYSVIRKDRKTRGSGVLLGIKTAMFNSVREIKHNHDLEIAMAEVTTAKDIKMLICSCYRPPDADKTWIDKFETFLHDVCTRHSKIVIAGDFNFARAGWNSRDNYTDVNENPFRKLLNDFFLEQMKRSPTIGENILDLVITTDPDRVKIIEVLKPSDSDTSTDHNAIIFDLFLSYNPFPKLKRTVFDYRRSDFDGLRRHLQTLDLSQHISENGEINQDWISWKNAFLEAVSKFVPTKTLRDRNHLPWMNSTILHYIKKKNSIRIWIKRSCHPSDHIKKSFRELRTTIKRMLRDGRLDYINSICSSREYNPKRFWSFFKIKSKVSNIPLKVSVKTGENQRMYFDNNAEIANTFNEYFASIFTSDTANDFNPEQHPEPDNILEDITLTNDEVST
ncbi:uncharacterized protein LOC114545074, partial [Dendronephthya gigantea]|uniref:uncharacterized protein LOC114545074 n=1 Tax=Dendronephthya gigantea TaxID=151771 RepID=UPI00106D2067